jgi:hypothetical protein
MNRSEIGLAWLDIYRKDKTDFPGLGRRQNRGATADTIFPPMVASVFGAQPNL